MDLLALLTGLAVGTLAGAFVAWSLGRARLLGLAAERDLLHERVTDLESAASQDRELVATLSPLAGALQRVEDQVRTLERDRLQASLQAQGVQTGIHYPIPVHLQAAHADLGYREGAFPVSERAARETLSLPMYPELSEAQIEQVVAAVSGAAVAR